MQVLFIVFPLLTLILINLPFNKLWKHVAFYICAAVLIVQMIMVFTTAALIWAKLIKNLNFEFIVSLNIDLLTLVVLFTIGLIAFISLFVNRYSRGKDDFNFVNLLLIVVLGMNGVTMVRDLFALYVFLEATAITSFILIAIDKGIDSFEGAFKYYIMSALATIMMLTSISLIFLTVNSLNFLAVSNAFNDPGILKSPQIIIAIILFIAGLSVKAGLVPFHGWLPDAYSSASSGVSILLAGIVTKVAGVYTIMRIVLSVFNSSRMLNTTLMILGIISILVGALAAIGQKDFKRMLAYSSISQVGYIIFGLGIGSPLAYIGAILHFFNHATFKSLLFVNSAVVEKETGTRDMDKLGGLASKMPITGGTSVIAFLSTSGIPPLSGFWSKLFIILAAWLAGFQVYAVIALLASLLTLGYFLILQRKVFFGKLAAGLENVKEGSFFATLPAIILSVIILAVGLLFPFILTYLRSIRLL